MMKGVKGRYIDLTEFGNASHFLLGFCTMMYWVMGGLGALSFLILMMIVVVVDARSSQGVL
jgi:hypothetical protein